MGERPGTGTQYSRRLPPPDAWKRPDRWIDLRTGLAKPDRSLLVLPVDDRGFVKTDEAIEEVKDRFFWNDYDWPFTPGDVETEPDDHHFYFDEAEYAPEQHGGNYVPRRFRELPTHIGRMPRQFHNVLHDFTAKPEMPDFDEMGHYVQSYQLALQAFRQLFETAKGTINAERKFASRRRSLAISAIRAASQDDRTGQAILRSAFDSHFRSYSEAIELFKSTEHRDLICDNFAEFEGARRKQIATKLGKVVTRQHINYTPLIRGPLKAAA